MCTYTAFWVRLCTAFAQCMRLCVCCTDFTYVCAQIWAMYAALHRLYGFCARFVWFCTMYAALRRLYGFCDLSCLCIHIRLLRVKRLVRTHTVFARLAACAYIYGFYAFSGLCVHIRLLDSYNVSVIQSWGSVDLFDVQTIQSWGLLICLTFMWPLVMIGPPGGSVQRIWSSGFFGRRSARSD